jgi:hypothetical protein
MPKRNADRWFEEFFQVPGGGPAGRVFKVAGEL